MSSSLTSTSCGPFRHPAQDVIEYARFANKGKTQACPIYRELNDISAPTPSIAQHSCVMGLLCFSLPSQIEGSELDRSHCIQLSVVHGLMQVSEDLCRNSPAKDLSNELRERKNLASRIVLEVDQMAMWLLRPYETGSDDQGQTIESFSLLRDWARQIIYKPTINEDSAGMTDSSEPTGWSIKMELRKRGLPCPGDNEKSLYAFARIVAHLTHVPRQGWVNNGIPQPESVADHCWSMASYAFELSGDEDVIIENAVRGCIVHDLAESVVGDITYRDNIDKRVKHRRESLTMDFLQRQLEEDAPLKSSWDEFETAKTPTGRAANDLDNVDLAIQALVYAEETAKPLDEFFYSARRVIVSSELIQAIDEARSIRGSKELDPKTQRELDNYYGDWFH
ncbi:hypothetical protein IL306_014275 [Fusarium sp. DS 682]|nr:hypothetical protein IL306_014275 [Fusarium sp. DS 682]